MNVSNFLHQSAINSPNRIAFYDNHGTMSYAELSKGVNDTAQILSKLKIGKNCGVGVMGGNSRFFVQIAFAVMQTGAVVLPIASNLSNDELISMITISGLHYIICEGTFPKTLLNLNQTPITGLPDNWSVWNNELANSNKIFANHVPDAALIRFTSGTTGKSKGVILSHQTISERTEAANSALQLNNSDTVLWVLSMAYHFVVSIILYIRYGCSIVINNDFLAGTILKEINFYKATFVYASPLHIRMLAADNSSLQLSHVKKVISTSTAISTELCISFHKRYGVPVSQAYGIIEIGLPVINLDSANTHPDSIGYAVKGFDVEIIDDDFNLVEPNNIGHLAIRGPGMFDAYLQPPQLRNEILQHNWFLTGDLAIKNESGLISIKGRKKSVINVAGNKVFPEEVEQVLKLHHAVEDCLVKAHTHSLLGECVMAEIQLRKNTAIPEVEELLKFCRNKLSNFKVPQKIVFVNELVLTGSGKVKR
jgi:long-chain acyl-CoA synthetase